MNIYKIIYDISKKKIQFFIIILISGFLGINMNKLFETKYFFIAKTKFSVTLDNNPNENMNLIISNLENDFLNKLLFKNNYIINTINKNLYKFEIYLKKNDTIEQEMELQHLLKLKNEYKNKFLNYTSNTKKYKEEELKSLEELIKLKSNNNYSETIQKIYELKRHIIILDNSIKSIDNNYPIQINIEKKILEDKIKINKYAMAILMIIFSILMFITFRVINDEYKKEIKKFK